MILKSRALFLPSTLLKNGHVMGNARRRRGPNINQWYSKGIEVPLVAVMKTYSRRASFRESNARLLQKELGYLRHILYSQELYMGVLS